MISIIGIVIFGVPLNDNMLLNKEKDITIMTEEFSNAARISALL